MISNGHSWLDIKKYTLSEIGIFFKTTVLMEREEKAEQLQRNWMSSNLEYKGLKEFLTENGLYNSNRRSEVSQEQVTNDWKRLASLQQGLK